MSDELRAWLNELRSRGIGSETAAQLIDKCEELAGALEEAAMLLGITDDANENFERLAAQFYQETGMLAPGKDDLLRDTRGGVWKIWLDKKRSKARAKMRAAMNQEPKPEGRRDNESPDGDKVYCDRCDTLTDDWVHKDTFNFCRDREQCDRNRAARTEGRGGDGS